MHKIIKNLIMPALQNRLAGILEGGLAYNEYPPPQLIAEAIALTTRHRQPLQVFYHAIRAYVRKFIRSNIQIHEAELHEDSKIVGHFLSYYFWYSRDDPGPDPIRRAASDLRTGLHNYEYRNAARALFAEGYRAIIKPYGWWVAPVIGILPPVGNPYYILHETAPAA